MTKDKDKNKSLLFGFNLMSQKSKEEIKIINERDESTLYAFVLVFSGILIYFLLTLLHYSFIETRIKNTEKSIASVEQQITALNSVSSLNGELYVKSNLLTPILEKDVKLNQFLDISFSIAGTSEILSYSREKDGSFIIDIAAKNYEEVTAILQRALDTTDISNVQVRNISFHTDRTNDNKYVFPLEFNLNI